jgi:hypothetical protein
MASEESVNARRRLAQQLDVRAMAVRPGKLSIAGQ